MLDNTIYSRTCLERSPHWLSKYGVLRHVVFGDRFNCIEMWDLRPGIFGPSGQVVFHGSSMS